MVTLWLCANAWDEELFTCYCAGEPAWGADGQGTLMKDIHCTMLRLMEGIDQEVQEAPTLAGYGSAADLSPHEAYRYLMLRTWCRSGTRP